MTELLILIITEINHRFNKLFNRFKKISETPDIGLITSKPNVYVIVWDDFYIYYSYNSKMTLISIVNVFHQKENV